MRRKALSLVLAALMVIGILSGCNSSDPKSTAASKEPADSVASQAPSSAPATGGGADLMAPPAPAGFREITFWYSQGGSIAELIHQMANDYNATIGQERKSYIRPIYQGGYADASLKLATILQSGNKADLPDIQQLNSTGAFTIKESPDVVWVSDLIDKYGGVDMADLEENCLQATAYKGRILGLPSASSCILLFYNKDAFREVGLDPDKPPTTLEEVAEYAAKLYKEENGTVLRYGFSAKPWQYHLSSWITMQGNDCYQTEKEDGRGGLPTKVQFDTDGTLANFLTEYQRIVDSGGLDPTTDNAREQFQAGMTAMYAYSMTHMPMFRRDKVEESFEWGAAILPRVDGNSNTGTAIGGSSLFFFDRGDEQAIEDAWDYALYLASPEQSARWSMETGYFPLNKKAYDLPEYKEFLKDFPEFQVAIDALRASDGLKHMQEPWVPAQEDYSKALQDNIQLFAEGEVTQDECIENIVEEANSLFAAYARANPEK